MDTSKIYTGHVARFDYNKYFGFIETDARSSYFFFYDKAEVARQRRAGFNTGHKFSAGDEVEFKLRPSLKDPAKAEAYDVIFIRNERRDKLIEEANNAEFLLGYLKQIDGDKLFVKHISTYMTIPVNVSAWEMDLKKVYTNRLDQLVSFTLTDTEKPDKLSAVLKDRVFSPAYEKVSALKASGEICKAIIKAKNADGYAAVLINAEVDAFIPLPRDLSPTETAAFFCYEKAAEVAVRVKNIYDNGRVSLGLAE